MSRTAACLTASAGPACGTDDYSPTRAVCSSCVESAKEKRKSNKNYENSSKTSKFPAYPLAQTYHRPQGTAEGAAAANAPAKQPLDVDGQRLLEDGVDALDGGLKLLGGDARHQTGWELRVEAVAQAEAARKMGV